MKQDPDPSMADAIEAVLSRGIAIREAARKFGVPRTTLQRKVQRAEAEAEALAQERLKAEAKARAKARAKAKAKAKALAQAQVQATATTRIACNSALCANCLAKVGGDGAMPLAPTEEALQAAEAMLAGAGVDLESIRVGGVAVNRKRSADAMTEHAPSLPLPTPSPARRVKGPRKAINSKIRMLCNLPGSSMDHLAAQRLREGKSVYKLATGVSPFPIPQCIVDELRANAHQKDYLPVAGLPQLRADIAAWGTRSLGLPYTQNDVIVGPGTKELLFVLQTVYYGDLLLPNPSWTSYAPHANLAGRNVSWLQTYPQDGWFLRPEVLEEHCRKDPGAPRVLILNTPSNPTGCVYTKTELQAVADVARKYRMLVISDEIYSELHYTGDHHSISSVYPEGTIVSSGFSKWCGAGGWRMGFWLFPSSLSWLRKSMLVMASETYTSVAAPIQYAARRAFVPDCIELASYKQKCNTILSIIGQWCLYQVRQVCADVHPPRGAFYIFPCLARHRKTLAARGILTDIVLCERLLADTGASILPGSAFGRDPLELYVRLAFVDFNGEIALYLIESMDNFGLADIDGFIQSVCPNVAMAVRKFVAWILSPPPPVVPHTTYEQNACSVGTTTGSSVSCSSSSSSSLSPSPSTPVSYSSGSSSSPSPAPSWSSTPSPPASPMLATVSPAAATHSHSHSHSPSPSPARGEMPMLPPLATSAPNSVSALLSTIEDF